VSYLRRLSTRSLILVLAAACVLAAGGTAIALASGGGGPTPPAKPQQTEQQLIKVWHGTPHRFSGVIEVEHLKSGKRIVGETVLYSAGRQGATAGLGLEALYARRSIGVLRGGVLPMVQDRCGTGSPAPSENVQQDDGYDPDQHLPARYGTPQDNQLQRQFPCTCQGRSHPHDSHRRLDVA
jgi:hypothetical protein